MEFSIESVGYQIITCQLENPRTISE
uniref:Uncharacterized protein n=1 Tax=Triticum urartu TaxID=4572 RepID=A0A8R7QXS6_TRIUA